MKNIEYCCLTLTWNAEAIVFDRHEHRPAQTSSETGLLHRETGGIGRTDCHLPPRATVDSRLRCISNDVVKCLLQVIRIADYVRQRRVELTLKRYIRTNCGALGSDDLVDQGVNIERVHSWR